jgi:hypothetical protein
LRIKVQKNTAIDTTSVSSRVNVGFKSQLLQIEIDSTVLENAEMPLTNNQGEGDFDNYLTMSIQFEPVRLVYQTIKVSGYPHLINRGEAHITVITPVEFRRTLAKFLTMDEINEIAVKMKIQRSRFKILGLGSGMTLLRNKNEETFFIVVDSEDLVNIRKSVFRRYVEKGGDPGLFDPERFFPHITVGYTKRDLHESDGIIKDRNSIDPRFQLQVVKY